MCIRDRYFLHQLGKETSVSATQECILVGVGLQCKTVDDLANELDFPVSQLLGLFNNLLKKLTKALNSIHERAIADTLDFGVKGSESSGLTAALPKQTMDEELEEAAEDLKKQQKENRDRLKFANLSQYQIKGDDSEWNKALSGKGTKSLISVKSGEKKLSQDNTTKKEDDRFGKKKKKRASDFGGNNDGGSSKKKKNKMK